MDNLSVTLNSTLTEEDWKRIADPEFLKTQSIYFQTNAGKKIYFVKRQKGKWNKEGQCPFCAHLRKCEDDNFCWYCGADLRSDE